MAAIMFATFNMKRAVTNTKADIACRATTKEKRKTCTQQLLVDKQEGAKHTKGATLMKLPVTFFPRAKRRYTYSSEYRARS